MYTLRKVFDNIQKNQLIGTEYQLIERDANYPIFKKAYEAATGVKHVADEDPEANEDTKNCFAILVGENKTYPLYKGHENYIMTDGGKTFCNLSYRKKA